MWGEKYHHLSHWHSCCISMHVKIIFCLAWVFFKTQLKDVHVKVTSSDLSIFWELHLLWACLVMLIPGKHTFFFWTQYKYSLDRQYIDIHWVWKERYFMPCEYWVLILCHVNIGSYVLKYLCWINSVGSLMFPMHHNFFVHVTFEW